MDQLGILGSPGTGKTTYIERLLKDKKDYIYLTYSRSMAIDARRRIQVDEYQAGTLHSILAKILHLYDWMQYKDVIEFCQREHMSYPERWSSMKEPDEAQDDWSQFITAYDRSVNTKTDIGPHEHLKLHHLKVAYENYKEETGKHDYTDILRMASNSDLPPVETLVVDEAQDLTPLMHDIIDLWPATHKVYAGDPDQSIYGFRGTSADQFIRVLNRGEIIELPHSYRFGDNVRVLGERIMSSVRNRIPKHYTGIGNTEIFRSSVSSFLELQGNKTILCRTNRLAKYVASILLPYPAVPVNTSHNLGNGWNGHILELTGIFHKYPQVSIAEQEYLIGYLPAEILVRGVKTAAKHHKLRSASQSSLDGYVRIFKENKDTDKIIKYLDISDQGKRNITAFYRKGLPDPVHIDTIHAAKGMEFENVLIITDRPEHISYGDEEHRIIYTGVTRVKKRLGITYLGREPYYYNIPI